MEVRALAQWMEAMARRTEMFLAGPLGKEIALTCAILLASAVLVRAHAKATDRWARSRPEISAASLRAKKIAFRNGAGFFAVVAVLSVWGGEIRSLLLSVAAIMAALLVVSKELIANFLGGTLWTLHRPAAVGETVEIGGVRGRLLDRGWTHLEILDASEGRPRSVRVPASLFLSSSVVNHSAISGLSWARAEIKCRPQAARDCAKTLLAAAVAVTAPWKESTEEHANAFSRQRTIETPDCAPKCEIRIDAPDVASVAVRFAVPDGKRFDAEQAVLDRWLESLAEPREGT